jgi:hypothetical protein
MATYLNNIQVNLLNRGGYLSDLDDAIASSGLIQNKITSIDSYIANLNSTATIDYIKYALYDCSVISTNLDNIKGSILVLTEEKMGANPGSDAIIWVYETVTYIMGGQSKYNTNYYIGLKPLLGQYTNALQALLPAN